MKLQLFKIPVLASTSISASTLTSILTSILTSALILTSILTPTTVKAQVGFGTNAANPNAIIDLFSSTKGLLIPRVALTATNAFAPLAANVAGMLLYNTATAGTAPNAVTPGFYYNTGAIWVRVADDNQVWKLNGNVVNGNVQFIGSTNNADVVFKRNNARAGIISNATTSFGALALSSSILSGVNNSAFGVSALQQNEDGIGNSALGAGALQGNKTGGNNTAFGYYAGDNLTAGNNNVAIGANTKFADNTGSNQLNIGNNIFGTGLSGTVSNVGVYTPAANPLIGINTIAPTNTLEIKSSAANTSGLTLTNLLSTSPTSAGTAIGVNAAGQVVTVAGGTGSAWDLTGNAGTDPAINFIGTTDNQDLVFKTNNTKSGLLGDNTTAFGLNALANNVYVLNNTGSHNSAFGLNALRANTIGNHNSAFGTSTLLVNTLGRYNSAFGSFSLEKNTTGDNNSAFGASTLLSNTIGGNNSAFGFSTLVYNTEGRDNTAVGSQSLNTNTIGMFNSSLGSQSLERNTTGSFNTAIGGLAMNSNMTGAGNVALGYDALRNNMDGVENTAIGNNALLNNVSGESSTGLGFQAGFNLVSGSGNLALGANTEFANSNGSNQLNLANLIFGTGLSGAINAPLGNIGIGTAAPNASAILDINTDALAVTDKKGVLLPQVALADVNDVTTIPTPANGLTVFNTTAAGAAPDDVTVGYYYYNTAITKWVKMQDALSSWSTRGNANTTPGTNFIGTTDNNDLVFKTNNTQSGRINLNNYSTSFGLSSLPNNDPNATDNAAFGDLALNRNTTGKGNTAIGRGSLGNNQVGASNTAIGAGSAVGNEDGTANTAIGETALRLNQNGNFNTAVGATALFKSTGDNNIGIGTGAGRELTVGNNNIAIGYQANFVNLTGSNQLNLANNIFGTGLTGTVDQFGAYTPAPNPRIGINTTAPNSTFEVAGSISASIRTLATGTVADNDYTVMVTGNISLPTATAANKGRIYHLINDTTGNPVITGTIRSSGINVATFDLGITPGNDMGITVQSTGTAWLIIGR